jgi:hypothetical protein
MTFDVSISAHIQKLPNLNIGLGTICHDRGFPLQDSTSNKTMSTSMSFNFSLYVLDALLSDTDSSMKCQKQIISFCIQIS